MQNEHMKSPSLVTVAENALRTLLVDGAKVCEGIIADLIDTAIRAADQGYTGVIFTHSFPFTVQNGDTFTEHLNLESFGTHPEPAKHYAASAVGFLTRTRLEDLGYRDVLVSVKYFGTTPYIDGKLSFGEGHERNLQAAMLVSKK